MSENVSCKASQHVGKKYSTRHNLRTLDTDRSNLDGHIDYDRTHLNQTLVNVPLRTFFDETFGDDLIEFNHKNWIKHPERVIGYSKREYDSLVKTKGEEVAKEKERDKAVRTYLQQQKKQVQEVIIQFGNHDTYLHMVDILGQKRADEFYSEMLKHEFEEWQKRNPAMKVFCATVHMDEVKEGTPHLHIDFLPVAESKTGLKTKVNVDGALKECGFKRDKKNDTYEDRPYTKWLNSNREKIERDFEAFANRFLQTIEQFKDKIKVTVLPSEETPKGHKRKTTAQWREEQARQRAEQAEKELSDLQTPPKPTIPTQPRTPRITESRKDYINRNIKEYVEDMRLGHSPKDMAETARIRKKYGEEWDENQRQWSDYDRGREEYAQWEQDTSTQTAYHTATERTERTQQALNNERRQVDRKRQQIENIAKKIDNVVQEEKDKAYDEGVKQGEENKQRAIAEATRALQEELNRQLRDTKYLRSFLERNGLDIDEVVADEEAMQEIEARKRRKSNGYTDYE